MGTHFIFADTHHGAQNVVAHLTKKGKGLHVSSTGDFPVYCARDNGPKVLDHPSLVAYRKGDSAGQKQHETDWIKQVANDTPVSAEHLKRLKDHLVGGQITSVYGNSDATINTQAQKVVGKSLSQLLGGRDSVIKHISGMEVRHQDDTALVYVSHDPSLVSKYQGKDYKVIRADLTKDAAYQSRLKQVSESVGKKKNIAVLMHEAPKPEKWYKGDKVKKRLPDPLRAHYDSVVEYLADKHKGNKIDVFHGHLHEATAQYRWETNTSKLPQVTVNNLNIDDVVAYDTVTGRYKVEHAAHVEDLKVKRGSLEAKTEAAFKDGQPKHEKKSEYQKEPAPYKKAA